HRGDQLKCAIKLAGGGGREFPRERAGVAAGLGEEQARLIDLGGHHHLAVYYAESVFLLSELGRCGDSTCLGDGGGIGTSLNGEGKREITEKHSHSLFLGPSNLGRAGRDSQPAVSPRESRPPRRCRASVRWRDGW